MALGTLLFMIGCCIGKRMRARDREGEREVTCEDYIYTRDTFALPLPLPHVPANMISPVNVSHNSPLLPDRSRKFGLR